MKNSTPNENVFFEKKMRSFQKLTYLMLFSFLFISASALAQTISIEGYTASLSAKSETEATTFDHLLKDLQPAVYFTKEGTKNYGDQAVALYIGLDEIANIKDPSISKDNIEIIYLDIKSNSDLKNKIDLDNFITYPKLKYICILSTIPITENTVNQLIKNYNSQFVMLLRVVIGG